MSTTDSAPDTFYVSCAIEDTPYLRSSARLRNVSRSVLVKKLLEVVIRDQLILAILEDDLPVRAKDATQRTKAYNYDQGPRRQTPRSRSTEGLDEEDPDGGHP